MKVNYSVLLICAALFMQSCSSDDEIAKVIEENTEDTTVEEIPTDVENSAPDAFDLLVLENEAIDVELSPTLSWQLATDANEDTVTYDLILDTSENPETIIAADIDATEFTLTAPLQKNTSYFWKVNAKDGNEGETLSSSTYTFTTRGTAVSDVALTSNAAFSKRSKHTTTEFQNKLWLIGGRDEPNTSDNIWSSVDGENWTLEVEEAFGFLRKSGHTALVFKEKLWVIAGGYQDVWSSINGKDWVRETISAEFGSRENHSSVVYDGKMWVIGGTNTSLEQLNDVWSSEDGITWTEMTSDAEFSPRSGQSSVVFNNQMYVMGGTSVADFTPTFYNDVYTSTNGVDWMKVDTNNIFGVREAHKTIIYDNQLWVIGGWQAVTNNETTEQEVVSFNDGWYSDNGIDWTRAFGEAGFKGRLNHTAVAFDDKIFVIGGLNIDQENNTRELFNDIWTIE